MANDFVTIVLTKDLDVGVDTAWSKIGKFSDIERWMDVKCTYKSGSGEVGSVRSVVMGTNIGEEVMVAKTSLSYTYTTVMPFLPFYHGTLAVESTGTKTSKIVYTLLWDQDTLSAEQREKGRGMFMRVFPPALDSMKKLAEG